VLLLENNNIDFTVIEYLKTRITKKEILSLSVKLGMPVSGFIRKNESDFRENNFNSIIDNNNALAEAVAQYPKIMERPIAVRGERAVVGRPPDKILALIN